MRVFDIALAFVRAYAAIQLVGAAIELVSTALRFWFVNIGFDTGEQWTRLQLSSFMFPTETAALGVGLLVVARPLARFASRFAAATDIAGQF